MTLEEKIDAFVLAQGNQVGAGAELAGILKEIAAVSTQGGKIIELPTEILTTSGIREYESLADFLAATGGKTIEEICNSPYANFGGNIYTRLSTWNGQECVFGAISGEDTRKTIGFAKESDDLYSIYTFD